MMFTKLATPTTTAAATAFGQPLDIAIATIQASAESLRLAAEKVPSRFDTFGQQIAQAVKNKVRLRHPCFNALKAEAESEGESFGEKLKKAVKEKSGAKQHKEQVKREGARYRHQRK
jgi:non-homologous end joining protein Ku